MTIDALRLHSLQMPLVRPFRTSFGTQHVRDVMLVEAIDSDGVQGWGECVTLGWPGYNAEYTAGAIRVIKEYLAPIVLGKDWTPDSVHAAMKVVRGHHIARASVGTAVLDVWLRRAATSLGDYLGATRTEVDCGVSVGIPASESTEELLEEVGMYVDAGYRRIKLKIEPGWDTEPVAAVQTGWIRSLTDRAAVGRRGLVGSHAYLSCMLHPDLPGRINSLDRVGRVGDRVRRCVEHQHQAGPGGRVSRSQEDS